MTLLTRLLVTGCITRPEAITIDLTMPSLLFWYHYKVVYIFLCYMVTMFVASYIAYTNNCLDQFDNDTFLYIISI